MDARIKSGQGDWKGRISEGPPERPFPLRFPFVPGFGPAIHEQPLCL
jgi:hypothetical protein